MKKRSILAIIFAVVLAMGLLAGCGGSGGGTATTAAAGGGEQATEAAPADGGEEATTAAATCSTLYYILRYDRYNSADVIKMKPDSPYYQIGTASFATGNDSIAYGGYQYGDLYLRKSANISEEANHSKNINYFNQKR